MSSVKIEGDKTADWEVPTGSLKSGQRVGFVFFNVE